MKFINTCLIALVITTSLPTYSLRAISSYKPGIIIASGALISGATAAWAHRKVKQLESLSDFEKNKPETKKALAQWKNIRTVCGTLSFLSSIFSARNLYFTYQKNRQEHYKREIFRDHERLRQEDIKRVEDQKIRENIESAREHARIRSIEQQNSTTQQHQQQERVQTTAQTRHPEQIRSQDNNTQYKNQEKAARIKEQMKQQREAAKKRAQEKATEKAKNRNGAQIKNQEEVIKSIAPLLIEAAQDGDIEGIKNLANQCQGEAQANLLNTRDAQGNTAWYYARQNSNQQILEYAREKAAQTSNYICGMCKDDESRDTSQYAVGSPSYNCLHFFHKGCIATWRSTHNTCPACRQQ